MSFYKEQAAENETRDKIAEELLIESGEAEEHDCFDLIDLGGGAELAYAAGLRLIARRDPRVAAFGGDGDALKETLDSVLQNAPEPGNCHCGQAMAKDD